MSPALLDARGIERHYGGRAVLSGVDLRVGGSDRVALVGPNGSGKSTLLRIVAGCERPDAGEVVRHGRVGYLPQLAADGRGQVTVRELILEQIGVTAASRELERQERALAAGDVEAIERHAAALEGWLAVGAEDADARLRRGAAELGLPDALLDRPMGTLSGGQASRAGLAALTVVRADVVLLDEPTNHLDADGLERLRMLLAADAGAAVVVSHDRALLADVATVVVELDSHDGSAHRYGGGWAVYEHERHVARERAQAAHDDAVARREAIAKTERELRRRAAASRTRVAHKAADGDKHVREWVRARSDGAAARARRVGNRAERIEVPDAPWRERPLRLWLTPTEGRSPQIVALEGALLTRGSFALGPIDLTVEHGDRLLLSGPNGSGKSTLLDALAGTLGPTAGVRRTALGAVIARLGQHRDALAGERSLTDEVRALTGLEPGPARTALASFGLGADAADRTAATLSPGERTRGELTVLAQQRASCLLLDEPTNHLDMQSLEVLEAALRDWRGALVVATHDHRLATELALTRELTLDEQQAHEQRVQR